FSAATAGLAPWLAARLGGLGVPRLAEVHLPAPLAVVVCVVLLDVGQYASHRLLHAASPLWEFHKVHHSAKVLDWLANSRSHVVENALRRVVAPAGLVLLGVPPSAAGIAGALLAAWAIFIH